MKNISPIFSFSFVPSRKFSERLFFAGICIFFSLGGNFAKSEPKPNPIGFAKFFLNELKCDFLGESSGIVDDLEIANSLKDYEYIITVPGRKAKNIWDELDQAINYGLVKPLIDINKFFKNKQNNDSNLTVSLADEWWSKSNNRFADVLSKAWKIWSISITWHMLSQGRLVKFVERKIDTGPEISFEQIWQDFVDVLDLRLGISKINSSPISGQLLMTGATGTIGGNLLKEYIDLYDEQLLIYRSESSKAKLIRKLSSKGINLPEDRFLKVSDLGNPMELKNTLKGNRSKLRNVAVYVSSAGASLDTGKFLDNMSEEEILSLININIRAVFIIMKEIISHSKHRKLRFTIVGSSIDDVIVPLFPEYQLVEAVLGGVLKIFSELEEYKERVTFAINRPGPVDSGIVQGFDFTKIFPGFMKVDAEEIGQRYKIAEANNRTSVGSGISSSIGTYVFRNFLSNGYQNYLRGVVFRSVRKYEESLKEANE